MGGHVGMDVDFAVAETETATRFLLRTLVENLPGDFGQLAREVLHRELVQLGVNRYRV